MHFIKFSKATKTGLYACLFCFSLPLSADTKVLVPIEDLSEPTPAAQIQARAQQQTQQQTQQQNANTELFMLLESLQQEVASIRGQMEELTFKLRRMEQNQKDRYMDLDRRIADLNAKTAVLATPKPLATPTVEPSTPVETTQPKVEVPVVDPAQQQADYKAAFNLIRSKEYKQAVDALQMFVANYPNGALTGNAYYWLGEVYMVERQTELAIEQFSKVISQFPEHRKVPDAMYKAGRAWVKLGDTVKGQRLLDRVIELYPDSSSARLARELK